MKMTTTEIAEEVRFRFSERIAFLCEAQDPKIPPTLAQMQIAELETEQWRERYHQENP